MKMKQGTKYTIGTNIHRRRKFTATFIRENEAGYFFDTGCGELFIEKANWIRMKVKEVR